MDIIPLLVTVAAYIAVLFGCAGRWDLPWCWAVMAVQAAIMFAGLFTIDPGLVKERLHPGEGGKDRYLRHIAIPFLVASLVIAGLDIRFGWSGEIPVVLRVLGLAAGFLGGVFSLWAIYVNRFFSPVVRIQEERGHILVTAGPYQYLRHPGYLGFLVGFALWGLPLGSWWSMIPALPVMMLFLRRIVIEDRFLHENLPGYPEYAQRVRYRLIPGVW